MIETKFKETEVGRMPADWEVKTLGEILSIGNGRDYKHLRHGKIPVYGTGGLMTYVDNYLYEGETVCIGRKGTIDEPQYHTGKIWTVDTLFYTYDFKETNVKFLYYLSTTLPWNSYNEATGVPSLTSKNILSVTVSLPPLPEQRRIASALTNIDDLISNLDTLIEKKRNIKQGAMQQLLTGKTRLKGFTEPWVEKKLGEVVYINPASEREKPDQFIYIDLESVKQGKLISTNIVNRVSAPSRAQRQFEQSDILYQTVRPYQSNNLYIDFDAAKYIASTGYAVLRSHEDTDSRYVYMYLHTYKFVGDVLDNCTGTSYPAINPNKLAQISIFLPSSLSEQRAIASILTKMDSEITALEQRREKYAALKQGMMQQLLTGKIRLTD